MSHFPHPRLSPITLNHSIPSLPHPHYYLPFQPPASPSTMPQFLSLITHISHVSLHTPCCGRHLSSWSYSSLDLEHISYFPVPFSVLSSKIRSQPLQKDFWIRPSWIRYPYIALSSSNIPIISHCVINMSSLPLDCSSLSLGPTVSYSPGHSQILTQHLEHVRWGNRCLFHSSSKCEYRMHKVIPSA